jgi:hypothetical protein
MNGINTERATGKSRGRSRDDDVTRSTTGQPSSDQTPSAGGRGRPKELQNPKRTSMTLEEDHVEFLDDLAARIKLGGGEKMSRGALLRALLDALMRGDEDLEDAKTADDVTRRLLKCFRKEE